mmetsp:Transcript_24630/g.33765  ORF Transcript_24630/g.33765 Transcript_24630/m.33765 type:complete len:243 (-) Transcript_24630:172-900(-)
MLVAILLMSVVSGFPRTQRLSSAHKVFRRTCPSSSANKGGEAILTNGDAELSNSLTALAEGDIAKAKRSFERANELYARDGIISDREEFLTAVSTNIDRAEAASRVNSHQAAVLQVDPDVYNQVRNEGDKLMMAATQAHTKNDFEGALYNIQSAREVFSSLCDGGMLARDREAVLGNLYSVVLSDIQRQAHMVKLLRIKKLGELVKLKSKAKLYGIDLDDLEDLDDLGNPILDSVAEVDDDM